MKEVDPPPPEDLEWPETPEELRAVLRALGREAPGRGTLERVARELSTYMDAAPGLHVPVAAAARTGGKLIAARALAALLALGGTAYVVQLAWPAPQAHEVAAPVVHAPVVHAPVVAAPVRELEAPALVARPEPQVEAAPTPVKRARRHARPTVVQPSVVETSVVETRVAPAAAAPVAEVARVQELGEEPAPAKKPAPPPDEYALLWQARERMGRDPAGALALLDDAAARFEKGQLAPEREVLAIEALRALGRTEQADARTRAFRARYPGSIHLRRLQQGR